MSGYSNEKECLVEPPVDQNQHFATLRVWRQGTVAQIELNTVCKYEDRARRSDIIPHAKQDKDTGDSRKWKRGKVKPGLSKGARLRMLQETGKLDRDVRPLFCTLTYADENWRNKPEEWKMHLRALNARLARHYPNSAAIWRLELEVRKSGSREGELAPHFHLIIWLNTAPVGKRRGWRLTKQQLSAFRDWLDDAWSHGTNNTKVPCNRNSVTGYILKYMAKAGDEQTGEIFPDGVGRLWGKWGADNLPMSDEIEITLTWYEGLALIRAFRRMIGIDDFGFTRLSCFVDPDKFLDDFEEIIERELQWMAEETPISNY